VSERRHPSPLLPKIILVFYCLSRPRTNAQAEGGKPGRKRVRVPPSPPAEDTFALATARPMPHNKKSHNLSTSEARGSMKIRKTLGIDLGTTNSVLALLDPTDSALITATDDQGHKTFPS